MLFKITGMRKSSILLLISIIVFSVLAKAQNAEPEMADVMRSNGKIYVVVLVLATIFAGIIWYLIRLDKKIGKIEQQKQH